MQKTQKHINYVLLLQNVVQKLAKADPAKAGQTTTSKCQVAGFLN